MINEQEILTQIRNGEQQDVAKQLYGYYPFFRKHLKAMGASIEEVEDLFQEALVIFYERAHDENFQLTVQAHSYILRIGAYLLNNMHAKQEVERKHQSKVAIEFELRSQDLDSIEDHNIKMSQLKNLLEKVSERCREIFNLYYKERYTMKAIAATMNFSSERSAKTQKYKCIERMRSLYKK